MPPRSISSFTPRFAPRLVYRALTFASRASAFARLAPPTRNVVATRSLDRVRILSGQREGRSIRSERERRSLGSRNVPAGREIWNIFPRIIYIFLTIFRDLPLPSPSSIDSRLFFTRRELEWENNRGIENGGKLVRETSKRLSLCCEWRLRGSICNFTRNTLVVLPNLYCSCWQTRDWLKNLK